ncbi:mitochondrial ribosomal protein S25-domain-containing protein [Dichomitus squalens]|uniref:Small ribosomal subunit protein mS23 n=1 Tax=Dichomitus squalens TaxID=114155 RepID=A0A4V2K3T8_9APHY|nr:mitochondrial ribosomal protein S25-domain-containing protein [Dichomitus squalens]TBU63703.1 mitochondrial ribosomal protein S25-domain-containing protein [Dichomitus squalens]
MATKRIANQVHKQASRLLREGYIQQEPAWFRAVLDNPPLPLPARAPPSRTRFDTPSGAPLTAPADSKKTKPLPIKYVEDELRRQFFRDHPFEAFRQTTLVEGATVDTEHPIRGAQWRRLRQRGRNPSPEDAIRYAVNLYEHHDMDLSSAYASAVAQFRSLRAELEVARAVARSEAEHLGMEFGPSQVEITFAKEHKAFRTFQEAAAHDHTAETERKRWKAVVEREGRPDNWTKGQEYTRLWKEGVRPVYAPVFVDPQIKPEGLVTQEQATQKISAQADFMKVITA